MKKILFLCLSACCSLFASAQTLYVKTHHATYAYAADEVSNATCGEITYHLSGMTDNGGLALEGSYKARIELAGLTLTNPAGAAVGLRAAASCCRARASRRAAATR